MVKHVIKELTSKYENSIYANLCKAESPSFVDGHIQFFKL
jgi:hypothetical protein